MISKKLLSYSSTYDRFVVPLVGLAFYPIEDGMVQIQWSSRALIVGLGYWRRIWRIWKWEYKLCSRGNISSFADDIVIWLMDSGASCLRRRQDREGADSFLQSSLTISTFKTYVIYLWHCSCSDWFVFLLFNHSAWVVG